VCVCVCVCVYVCMCVCVCVIHNKEETHDTEIRVISRTELNITLVFFYCTLTLAIAYACDMFERILLYI